jgi:hypothetical protein
VEAAAAPGYALELMLAHLSGGEAAARYHYIVDRRELTEKPRSRAAAY